MNNTTDPVELAQSALESGLVVIVDNNGTLITCDSSTGANPTPHNHPYGPIVGVSCPPGTAAVGYPVEATLKSTDCNRSNRVAVVVPVEGPPVILDTDRRRLFPCTRTATLIDLGQRAMGLATPPPDLPLIGLLDRVWLDRVLATVLDSDLGRPATWAELAVLHPAMPRIADPDQLSVVRGRFHTGWETLRQRIAAAEIRWPGLSPEVASWLDQGSVSRWCLADTPEPDPILRDLEELLDPVVTERLRASLAPLPPAEHHPDGHSRHGRQQ